MSNYYEILGLNRNASQEDIKRAYKEAAKKYHPDATMHKEDIESEAAEEHFKAINNAYSVLSDPAKRHAYDNPNPHADLFGGGFHNPFSNFGFENRPPSPRVISQPGRDYKYIKEVTFYDFIHGWKGTIEELRANYCTACEGTGLIFVKTKVCENCKGSGHVQQVQNSVFGRVVMMVVCPKCHGIGKHIQSGCAKCSGRGTVTEQEVHVYEMPERIQPGSVVTFTGRGGKGINASDGSVYIKFSLKIPSKDHLNDEQVRVIKELT